jgi:hypothetical protein
MVQIAKSRKDLFVSLPLQFLQSEIRNPKSAIAGLARAAASAVNPVGA